MQIARWGEVPPGARRGLGLALAAAVLNQATGNVSLAFEKGNELILHRNSRGKGFGDVFRSSERKRYDRLLVCAGLCVNLDHGLRREAAQHSRRGPGLHAEGSADCTSRTLF